MLSTNLNKDKAEQKAAARKKSDLVLYKLMLAFIVGIIGIFAMLAVGSSMQAQVNFITYALTPLLIISGLALAAAIVFFALQRSRHVDESRKVVTSAGLLGTAAVFFASCLYYSLSSYSGVRQIVIFLICAVVLYFVYNIFRTDFFLCSVVAAIEMNLVQISMNGSTTMIGQIMPIVFRVLAAAVPVAAIVFAVYLHVNKGTAGKTKLLEKGDHLYPLLVMSAASLIGAVLTILFPTTAVYAMIAILVVYLAIAVAYTVRMM